METLLKTFDLDPLDAPMIIVGAFLFLIFCKLFAKHVVQPFLQLVEARESAYSGRLEEAAADIKAAAELQKEFNAKISLSRTKGLTEKKKVLETAKSDAAKLIENAEAQAHQTLDSERAALKQALQEARKALHAQEADMVSLVMQKFELSDSRRSMH